MRLVVLVFDGYICCVIQTIIVKLRVDEASLIGMLHRGVGLFRVFGFDCNRGPITCCIDIIMLVLPKFVYWYIQSYLIY